MGFRLLFASLLALALPSRAAAYEDRWSLEAGPLVSSIPNGGSNHWGGGATLRTTFGLNDVWTLRCQGAYAIHPGTTDLHVGALGIDAVYMIDIVEWVPFLGLGIDAILSSAAGQTLWDPAVHLSIGVDYLLSRDLYVGVEVNHILLPFNDASLDPVLFLVSLRMGLLFDT
ncbi:MAG: hypothetical protein KC416_14055 [Myxococcales bacterium]|nr:hypothetical protein [Myxococcales bacterium]